jgi:hypothetical protein
MEGPATSARFLTRVSRGLSRGKGVHLEVVSLPVYRSDQPPREPTEGSPSMANLCAHLRRELAILLVLRRAAELAHRGLPVD